LRPDQPLSERPKKTYWFNPVKTGGRPETNSPPEDILIDSSILVGAASDCVLYGAHRGHRDRSELRVPSALAVAQCGRQGRFNLAPEKWLPWRLLVEGADNASPLRASYCHRLSRLGFHQRLRRAEDNVGLIHRPPGRKIVRRVVIVVQRAISPNAVTRTQYDDVDV
jgi:hypothetical protein